jgi:hypothetical protein
VASQARELEGASLRRANHALSLLVTPSGFDPAVAQARLDGLLGESSMGGGA